VENMYIGKQLCRALYDPQQDPAVVGNAKKLIQDPDTLWAVVYHRGDALRFADDRGRANKAVVIAAVTNDPKALKYAALELQANPEVLKAVGLYATERDSSAEIKFTA